jgi:hypothetical protein
LFIHLTFCDNHTIKVNPQSLSQNVGSPLPLSPVDPGKNGFQMFMPLAGSCEENELVPVEEARCQAAGAAVLPEGETAGRALQVGDWSWVPAGCTVQDDASGGITDWAPHYNSNFDGTTRIDAKSYRTVCEAGTESGKFC